MACPHWLAIFDLRQFLKIQSHIVAIRIFKMHKIIAEYEFICVY